YSAYGGVENICRQFFHYLKECGVPVRLYCGFDKSGESDPDVVRLPVRRGARSIKAWTFWRSASAAVEQLPAGFVSMAFATVPGCDVFRCGGVHLDYLVKSLRAYASTGAKIWKTAKRAASPINWLQPAFDHGIYTHSGLRRIVAISSLMAEEIEERFPAVKDRIAIVPNGVDASQFNLQARDALRESSRTALGLADSDLAVGFCSTNMELKGLAHIIRCLPHCPERMLALVASGRRPDRFQTMAREAGVEHRVRFLGRVEDMPRFYAALDALCHPSAYDTFANVVPEALAMGVPVATTPWVGAKDLIRQGENGLILDPGDPAALAEGMVRCAAIPARNQADAVPDIRRTFVEYLDILREVHKEKALDSGKTL
ncbi:MAG: glycosyltransferase family 4 protein, partial [Desulfovibrionaceae bacterium]